MDVIASVDQVRGWALSRPRIVVLASPDRTSLGWRVEEAAASRGWGKAGSPADADVLVVVGDLPPDLSRAADLWWHHMTAPRSRINLPREGDDEAGIQNLLDAALVRLRDWDTQRGDAVRTGEVGVLLGQRQTVNEPRDDPHAGHSTGGHTGHDMGGHAGHDMAGDAEHDMGGHDMGGGHAGHDMDGGHAGHDMGSVAGLPMAATGEDRDGLALDVLTHRWGPFLPGWPAGLVVRTTLSGDVVTSAVVEQEPARPETFPRPVSVAHALATVLDLAGWTDAARALSHVPLARFDGLALTGAEERWLSRVRRSRTLRWALRDVAVVDGQDAADRVAGWSEELVTDEPKETGPVGWTVHPIADLVPMVVEGTEMARARIAVASVALSPGRLTRTHDLPGPHGHHHADHPDHGDAS